MERVRERERELRSLDLGVALEEKTIYLYKFWPNTSKYLYRMTRTRTRVPGF